jgi:hypothetical protein
MVLGIIIAQAKRTGGSETSQYPEENKSNEIPQVVASERGTAQTGRLRLPGVVGPASCRRRERTNGLEGPAIAGDSPVVRVRRR